METPDSNKQQTANSRKSNGFEEGLKKNDEQWKLGRIENSRLIIRRKGLKIEDLRLKIEDNK